MKCKVEIQCESLTFQTISVDGGWSVNDTWSKCTKRCGTGAQTRNRTCTNPAPQHGGAYCSGDAIQVRECNNKTCPSKIALIKRFKL